MASVLFIVGLMLFTSGTTISVVATDRGAHGRFHPRLWRPWREAKHAAGRSAAHA